MAHDKSAHDINPGSEEPNLSLETAVASLASILVQSQDHKYEDSGDPQVAELLKQLTAADGVANGVEERLDGIIKNLDLLLTNLEKEPGEHQSSEAEVLNKTKETTSS